MNIDELMHGTWLLVVQLRLQATLPESELLWQHCTEHIEQTREQLMAAGLSPRSVEQISRAQCALIDEAVLGCSQADAYHDWLTMPLQAHFFDCHDAGERVYQDLREALAAPQPDLPLLTCLQRLLGLGFRGCYPQEPAPERDRLLAQLAERVAPLPLPGAPALAPPRPILDWPGWGSPLGHGLAAALLLGGFWWVLQRGLDGVVAALPNLPS